MTAPAAHVASACEAVASLRATVPSGTARKRLQSAENSLTRARIHVAAASLPSALTLIRSSVAALVAADALGVDTSAIQKDLASGVRVRLAKAIADVTAIAGAGSSAVVTATNLMNEGDALAPAGDYLAAVDKYVAAFTERRKLDAPEATGRAAVSK